MRHAIVCPERRPLPWLTRRGDDALIERLRSTPHRTERARIAGSAPSLRVALLDAGFDVDVEPLVALGTEELDHWTPEQAVSVTMHRHGNIVMARDAGPLSP